MNSEVIQTIEDCIKTKNKILFLQYCNLKKLPKLMKQCGHIETLILDNNELLKINLSWFPNLIKLNINYNKLTKLDLTPCSTLKSIEISNNEIRYIKYLNYKYDRIYYDYNCFKNIPLLLAYNRYGIDSNPISRYQNKLWYHFSYKIYKKIIYTILLIQRQYKIYCFLLDFYSVY